MFVSRTGLHQLQEFSPLPPISQKDQKTIPKSTTAFTYVGSAAHLANRFHLEGNLHRGIGDDPEEPADSPVRDVGQKRGDLFRLTFPLVGVSSQIPGSFRSQDAISALSRHLQGSCRWVRN